MNLVCMREHFELMQVFLFHFLNNTLNLKNSMALLFS